MQTAANRLADRLERIPCYLLSGGEENPRADFQLTDGLTRIEQSYRRYASLFSNVRIVVRPEQAKGWYLNYPHIIDRRAERGALVGIESALLASPHEAVFIGSSRFDRFSLRLATTLVQQYSGEPFLGYGDPTSNPNWQQPLFGIYHTSLAEKIAEAVSKGHTDLRALIDPFARMLPLPKEAAEELGLV